MKKKIHEEDKGNLMSIIFYTHTKIILTLYIQSIFSSKEYLIQSILEILSTSQFLIKNHAILTL